MTTRYQNAAAAYRQAATQVHPIVAVVKLYDEAIRRIRRAIEDTRAKKFEDAFINITRASTILRGLSSNLRFDRGSDVAEALRQAYFHNMIALHTAFGKRDAADRYGKIIQGLAELRDSWAEIAGMAPSTDSATGTLPPPMQGLK